VKLALVMFAVLGACALAGCQPTMTLEQARAACTKQGGFLVVLHTQKITMAGVGPEIDTPGDCVSPGKFDNAAKPPPAPAPAPAN